MNNSRKLLQSNKIYDKMNNYFEFTIIELSDFPRIKQLERHPYVLLMLFSDFMHCVFSENSPSDGIAGDHSIVQYW